MCKSCAGARPGEQTLIIILKGILHNFRRRFHGSDVARAAGRRRVIVLLEFYLHPFRSLSWTRPANQSEIGYSLTQTVSYWCFDLAVVISVTSAYGRPVGVSIGQSANRSVGRSVCRFVRSVGRSVGRWVG